MRRYVYPSIFHLRLARDLLRKKFMLLMLTSWILQAGTRFTEEQLLDILEICRAVFEEDEAEIPDDAEFKYIEPIPNKLLGARKTKKKGGTRKKA